MEQSSQIRLTIKFPDFANEFIEEKTPQDNPIYLIKIGLNASGKSEARDRLDGKMEKSNFVNMAIDNVVNKLMIIANSLNYNDVRFKFKYNLEGMPETLDSYMENNKRNNQWNVDNLTCANVNDILIQYFMQQGYNIEWEVLGINAEGNIKTVETHLQYCKKPYNINLLYPFVIYPYNLIRAVKRTNQPVFNFAQTMSNYTLILKNFLEKFVPFVKEKNDTIHLINNSQSKEKFDETKDKITIETKGDLITIQGFIKSYVSLWVNQPTYPKTFNANKYVYENYIAACEKIEQNLKTSTFSFYKNINNNVNVVKNMSSDGFSISSTNTQMQGGKKSVRKGSYESMTVKQLQERCTKKKIKYTGLKKAELISALRKK